MKTSHPTKSRISTACAAMSLCAATAFSHPAHAQQDVTDRDPDAIDVALTPLSDLNLSRDPIPVVLQQARANPYADEGYSTCAALRSEIGDLDAVLGDDFDTAPPEERKLTPEGVAQRVVGFFIPFRGIIREVSGANEHEYDFREAIAAGLMRRAYLKGLGQAMDCPYPARPATAAVMAQWQAPAESNLPPEEVMPPPQSEPRLVARPVLPQADTNP